MRTTSSNTCNTSQARNLANQPYSVNEIFDPWQPSIFYKRKAPIREASILVDRATNYGVVRLELINSIYEKLYTQALAAGPGAQPQNRILRHRTVTGLTDHDRGVTMRCKNATALYEQSEEPVEETLEFDAVILATGYVRDLHETMLKPLQHLLMKAPLSPDGDGAGTAGWMVDERYRVLFPDENVDGREAGIWLQGCNEKTHGVCLFFSLFSLFSLFPLSLSLSHSYARLLFGFR